MPGRRPAVPIEIRPGVLSEVFAQLGAQAEALTPLGLTPIALMVEKQAKINASNGEHKRGTPTPSPGDPTGPARVSGTLVRAITHTEPRPSADGWEALVGMAAGLYPDYNRHTPSSYYAYCLEVLGVGDDRHRFPFLEPAFTYAVHVGVDVVYREIFKGLGVGL